jgi:hypothetical protein
MNAPSPRLLLATLTCALSVPVAAAAAPEGDVGLKRLAEALRSDEAAALRLVWTAFSPSASPDWRLRVEAGRAALFRCASDCQPVGAPLLLSPGDRAQLVSRLRAAELNNLHDGDSATAPDRSLAVAVAGTTIGEWRLPRSDWPTPPDGYGVADLLDDLQKRIARAAEERTPLPIPATLAELAALRLQLRVQPRIRPGGLIVVEQGKLHVTPEEGSLPRSPRPRPLTRSLSAQEQELLLKYLQAARLDDLDAVVPKRAQPAIGDDDGRVATLHLLPSDATAGDVRAQASRHQPRGYERYLADLLRSPSAQLVELLLSFLVTDFSEGTAKAPPAPSDREAARRPR